MFMKICIKCNLELSDDSFYNRKKECKECCSIKQKEYYENNKEKIKERVFNYNKENKCKIDVYQKEYRNNNTEKSKDYNKEYYENNKEKIKENVSIYTNENKENISLYKKDYYQINKEKVNNYYKNYVSNRKKVDNLFSLKISIRGLIIKSFREVSFIKSSKTSDILGISFEGFKLHLESKFENWMTWENRGLYNGELNYGWDIDHIMPISSAKTEEEIIKLNHYSNLQPLCSYTNRVIKRDKVNYVG